MHGRRSNRPDAHARAGHVARILLLAAFGFVWALAMAPPPVLAADLTYNVDEGMCLTAIIYQTPPGSSWSISASGPFVGVVSDPVNGIYYGPTMGTSHSGITIETYDNFYSACNVCPVGSLSASFVVPGALVPASILGFANPDIFPASTAIDVAQFQGQCSFAGGALFGDLDVVSAEMAPVAGPLLIVGAIIVVTIVAIPVPNPPVSGSPMGPVATTVTQGSYMAETAHESTLEVPAGPPEPGQPVGGAGITVGPPDVKPPPTPPPNADRNLPPRCPRCGNLTIPAYGRWYCSADVWYPWG